MNWKPTEMEMEPTNTSNSQENIENNGIARDENVTLQSQEISPDKKYYSKFHRERY